MEGIIKRAWSSLFLAGLIWILVMGLIFALSSYPGSPVVYSHSFSYTLERKGAHVVEYFVLMLVSVHWFRLLFLQQQQRYRWILGVAFAWSVMFAVTDELHQFYVPFRGAKMTDVLIDIGGVALAMGVLALKHRYTQQRSKKKQKKQ